MREPGFWHRPAGVMAASLAPLAAIYGAEAARRLSQGRPYRASLPVICVGNFTVGGSGKTPFALMLAAKLIARGQRPIFLTRGYGGTERGPHVVLTGVDIADRVGDEPLLLARSARVMVARDRAAGAKAIEANEAATVIVMDDGMQNPTLVKDLTFAIIDGERGIGNGRVIPAGPLRLPLAKQGQLANAVVFNGPVADGLAEALACVVPVPQLRARLQGNLASPGRYVAFAGIGNPSRFFSTAQTLGADLVETVEFGDHARFSDRDAEALIALARKHGTRLLTTAKDHVRLTGSSQLHALAAASDVLPVQMSLDAAGDAVLDELLDRVLRSP